MSYRFSTPSLLALAIASGLAGNARADSGQPTDLDNVLVTGTRTEVSVADSLVPAQVIDRADIERSQAGSLAELLKGRAGIGIANQGGRGKITTVNIRGTESDQVLVLVDGIRIGSASAGLVAFQDLPVEQIERIEIVRGPRSSLYGSEAIGGVIQIFTRRGGKGLSRHLNIGAGSDNLREVAGGFGYGGEHAWLNLDAAYSQTDGFNACRGSAALFQGCYTDEPDDDGYRNLSVNLRTGYRFNDAWQVEANLLNADGRNEYDSSYSNVTDTEQQVYGGKLSFTPSDALRVVLSAGQNKDDATDHYEEEFRSHFQTRRDQASLQADMALGEHHLLTAGLDWQDEVLESDTEFDVTSRDNKAAYVEYQGQFGAHDLQASIRQDDNEQFGDHSTGSLGYGLAFGSGFKLTASVATGFKAPTFNDLYYPFFGKPDLQPESSKSANLGLAQYADDWNWTLNVYETRIDDLISYDSSIFLPNNIDKARIRGAEFTVDFNWAGFDVSTQLSHTDPRNDSRRTPAGDDNPNYDHLLARRAQNTARIDVDRQFGDFRLGLTGNGASHRYDDAANAVRLAGYGTLDLRVEYAINRQWTLQARAANVFDRDYETVAWYNQAGRQYGINLRYQARD
ncbi:TonB-dependent vitamin B12 receptor [Pseudoxanthomonas dokdonensis]|uniref:TonB-dependent receptor n=1 Tax=Pseudoxanthomonas dokdonensis TaxID=344882 RepID=A0A0R0CQ86_9GAMM|nr:TonB-dependent vitamin B12 receptor [Pseudoxanthomonas dokdonensis]KRG71733.1 TonB-dependent receptor [Pseudoxanthomonas dokdonensis]